MEFSRYTWHIGGVPSDILNSYDIKHKKIVIPLKDYSNFKPTILGENIYVYKGVHGNRPDYFKWDEIINPLIEVFGKERVVFTNHLPIENLVKNIYEDCFIYIKPNPRGGNTTMWELGHMGRRTLGFGLEETGYYKNYTDINNLIDLVVGESKYIGQMREDVVTSTKNIFVGDEWLTLKFWV